MKLTQHLRELIREAIIQHRYGQQQEELRQLLTALGDELYDSLFTPQELALMETLPNGWLFEASCFDAVIQGEYHTVSLSTKRRQPAKFEESSRVKIGFNNPTADAYLKSVAAVDELNKIVGNTRQTLRHALKSFGTVKQLRDGWPEIVKFIDEAVGTPRALAEKTWPVAIPLNQLNAQLGLPPDQMH